MTLTFQSMFDAIRARFKAQVEDTISPSLPTQYDNAPFTQPEDSQWCRLTILPAGSTQEDIGTATHRYRTVGVIIAQIFTPLEKGDKEPLIVADTIKTPFRSVSAAGVVYRTPSIGVPGRSRDNKWWQVNLTCPFYADDVS